MTNTETKTTTAIINGRSFELTPVDGVPRLKAHLATRGFEPAMWVGVSKPVGRQRKTITAHVYRVAKTGAFQL